jgi:hypothetical protein
MWDDDEDLVLDHDLPATCDVCGRPTQTVADHECKQCRDHCAVAAYRRAGAT